MERDPVRFVWRHALPLNLAVLVLALLVVPGVWLTGELVRLLVDEALAGRGFAGPGATVPFGRLALALPERIANEPIVLASGVRLGRAAFAQATLAGLALAALVSGLFVLAAGRLAAATGARAALALRRRLVDAIVSAPLGAGETVRNAARVAGDALAEADPVLGRAVSTPAFAAALILGALTYAASVDWRMAVGLVIGLAVSAAVARGRRGISSERLRVAAAAATFLQRRLSDVAARIPALAAHGTAGSEKRRLDAEIAPLWRPVEAVESRASLWAGLASAVFWAPPLAALAAGFLAAGSLAAGALRPTPGEMVAVAALAVAAAAALATALSWEAAIEAVAPGFQDVARTLGSLHARRGSRAAVTLPGSGEVSAEKLSAYEYGPGSGRLSGIDLRLALPSRVALVGESGSGARVFAALLGGQTAPASGRLTLAGVEIADAEPGERALRLAYAGGEPFLVPGSLAANLLYGCPDPDAPDIAARLRAAITAAGLDDFVYARGLSAKLDAKRDPDLAATIVATRRAVRQALAAPGLADTTEPFDPARYNAQATIGENILFGVPVGDTFGDQNLAAQPFVRGLLERQALWRPLARLGESLARSSLELFAELPERSALARRFAPVGAADRQELEAVLERRDGSRRGTAAGRDDERLIGLALRYRETRQRLGLLDDELRNGIVAVRALFARELPRSLQAAVELYDADRLCGAASLRDNLLFGRIAEDRAGAERDVLALVRRVLGQRGLDEAVMRLGLDAWLDLRPGRLARTQASAIDIARCLVRRPDNLVIDNALDGLGPKVAAAAIGRIAATLGERGLVVAWPQSIDPAEIDPGFTVIRFAGGRIESGLG